MARVNMCSWKSVIKQCNSELQQLLNLNCLTAALYAEGLLTDQEQQELANESPVPCKQNSHFIQKILPFKGEQSFKKFLKVLENDRQHCGHKELFDILVRCYKGAHASIHAKSITSGDTYQSIYENDTERMNVTKRQLKLVIGELIKEVVQDQFKELITLQKRHKDQELNRHKTLMNLINNLFNQQHNNSEVGVDVEQRRGSLVSTMTTTSFPSSANGSFGTNYLADGEESDTLSINSRSGSYLSLIEDTKSDFYSLDDEQLLFSELVAGRPRAKSLTSSNTVKEFRNASRSYSSINVNNRHSELLKPPSNSHVLHLKQGYSRSNSLPKKMHNCRIKENNSSQKQEPSCINSCKIPQENSNSSNRSPENSPIITSTATSSYNVGMTMYDHKHPGAADSVVSETITTRTSAVTLSIHHASDDKNDDNKVEPDTTMKETVKGFSVANNQLTNPQSSSLCGSTNTHRPSVHLLNQDETSDDLCLDSLMKEKPVPFKITSQFTLGNHIKEQQVYCQEKDGKVYFIAWMDKQVRSRRISKLGAQHDTVITYDPGTDTLSPKQFICRRANMTYAFGILNFKNRITLVAGDNPKFLDGSVYLYQLVECNKYQRAFSYKWNEIGKSVRSCSPVVASPTHAVCTTTDDCIMVCQLTNNSDYTLKALSINIYNEACTEEDTKWKVMSLTLPTTLLHENGHLTSGTVHQKNLYLSIKTGQGFGVMQVSIANLDGLERSTDDVANTVAFHTIIAEPSLTQYFLFGYSDKLLASIASVSKYTLSSFSIGLVTIASSSVKQTSSIYHQIPIENAHLHSVISVPRCALLVLVYYSPQFQSYVLNSISSSVF